MTVCFSSFSFNVWVKVCAEELKKPKHTYGMAINDVIQFNSIDINYNRWYWLITTFLW